MDAQEIRVRILLRLDEHYREDSSTFVDDADLAALFMTTLREVQDQLEILEEQQLVDLVKTFGPCYSAMIRPRGRIFVESLAATEPQHIGFGAHP
jgi:hypothetical protein